MKQKVLVIEHNPASQRLLKRVIGKAKLQVVCVSSLFEAKHVFANSSPESYLCAVVDYSLPDAPFGEAIDFAVGSFIPVVVITDRLDDDVREHILSKSVVDYIPKANAQVYEYLSRLLSRLERNKHIGVLVVDDSRSSRNTMLSLLRRHNFITYSASSADNTVELLQQHSEIRLVIIDQNMSNMSGVELVAKLRRCYDTDELSIIGLSSDRSASLLARFIKSGANDYLNKPFCHEEFFCRILQNVEHIEHIHAIRLAANADYLTGLPNRRHFFNQVESRLKRGLKCQALALIDLDNFKSINDKFGHDCGDLVLKEVAKLINKHFGHFLIARFGGEEFCVFMADTQLDDGIALMQAFRQEVSQREIIFADNSLHCTLSVGVTSKFDNKIESMLRTADQHLYQAKARGRNCVVGDSPN